jgi:4-hydroxybenzoyl-CoA thioesterase
VPDQTIFASEFSVSWGDCDPAGIVFYPNYFAWIDATFQAFLRLHGASQSVLRERFGAAGLGLMEAGATFMAPCAEGDRLGVAITALEWRARTLRVAYRGGIGDRKVLEGFEVRGLFVPQDGRLRAASLDGLRDMLEVPVR